jgi:hypothetical protein
MDTILVAVIILVLIIMSTLIITVTVFQSANNLGDAWKDMESQSISISDTEISILFTGTYTGGEIDVAVQNEGRTNLYDYPSWDVIIQSQSGDAFHFSYVEAYPPASGEWAIEGIFMADASPEVFNPNILDPGEVMNVAINPEPEMNISLGETGRIVISTPNGVTSPCFVTRE